MFNEFDLKILKYIDIVKDKVDGKANYTMGNVEFYPTEECNLNCVYCTFKDKNRNVFPFSKIAESMKKISPATITISGGGDPSCYKSEGRNIIDVVNLLKTELPTTKIALITNGQKTIEGDWIQKLEWLRVSIDAGNQQTFYKLKGGDLQLSLKSIISYLKNGCKSIGIGYVFNDLNVSEVPEFAWRIYRLITDSLGEEYLKKVFLEFRPTCKIESCNCQSYRYINDQIKTSDVNEHWGHLVTTVHHKIFNHSDNAFIKFVKNRSNLDSTKVFLYYNNKLIFERCYYCLIKMIVYPNGFCYPCVQKSAVRKQSLGNIIFDTQEQIFKNQLKCSRSESICDGHINCCNVISQKNAILEHYLSETDLPTYDVRWNDFF